MYARVLMNRGVTVTIGVVALVVGLILGLLAGPADSQSGPKGAAPVTLVDNTNPGQHAVVDESGAVKVSGDVQVSGDVDVGSVDVGNFPETQDVHVTNGRSDAVPVSLNAPASEVTVNSFPLTAAPGESVEFVAGEGFQPLTMFYTSVTGATSGEFVQFLNSNFNTVMLLRGEGDADIGQEDYSISLTHLIHIAGVRMACPADAGSDCTIYVTVTGYF